MLNRKRTYRIYALISPNEPNRIRYVGCTAHTLENRLYGHRAAAVGDDQRGVAQWFKYLMMEGLDPLVILIEVVSQRADHDARERYWINHYSGPDLLNMTTGGAGSPGAYTNRDKRSKAVGDLLRGIPLTEAHKAKISEAKMGTAMPESVKAALLKANIGKIPTAESNAKRSIAMTGFKHTQESKDKIGVTHRGKKLGPLPQKVKDKLRQSISNLAWINNGSENRRVQRALDLPIGWHFGRYRIS